jgi:hypothetical protein
MLFVKKPGYAQIQIKRTIRGRRKDHYTKDVIFQTNLNSKSSPINKVLLLLLAGLPAKKRAGVIQRASWPTTSSQARRPRQLEASVVHQEPRAKHCEKPKRTKIDVNQHSHAARKAVVLVVERWCMPHCCYGVGVHRDPRPYFQNTAKTHVFDRSV